MSGQRRVCLAVIGLRGVPDMIGGIETHCALLYPALARRNPELAITLLVRRRYVPVAQFTFRGLDVRALRAPRGTGLETLVHTFWALIYARLRLRATIVHLHGIGPGFFAPLARLLGMKVVVTDHATDFQRPKWGWSGRTFLRRGEQFSAIFAQRVICVSEALRQDLLCRHPAAAYRAVTIRHGVGLPPAPPEDDARLLAALGLELGRYLLAVTRLDETKRIEDLIAAHACTPVGTLPLVIVGASVDDDSYERELRAAAGPGVIFAGFCTGTLLTALYRRAALFLHASEMEGFALVVLEALSVGTRVAVSDIAVHREFGLPDDALFPLGDVGAISAAMAATAPRTAPWLPAAPIAARHSTDVSAAAHAALFRELLPAPIPTVITHRPVPHPGSRAGASKASNSRQ